MLEDVKVALGLTAHEYDKRVWLLIRAAFADLGIAGINLDGDVSSVEDEYIVDTVIMYCKAYFNSTPNETWVRLYETRKAQLQVANKYTKWGDD